MRQSKSDIFKFLLENMLISEDTSYHTYTKKELIEILDDSSKLVEILDDSSKLIEISDDSSKVIEILDEPQKIPFNIPDKFKSMYIPMVHRDYSSAVVSIKSVVLEQLQSIKVLNDISECNSIQELTSLIYLCKISKSSSVLVKCNTVIYEVTLIDDNIRTKKIK